MSPPEHGTQLDRAQLACWHLDRRLPGATAWNVARLLAVPGAATADAAAALAAAVDRRPELAVACSTDGSRPRIRRAAPLHVRALGARPHPRLLAELADEPFDLSTGPLLRAVVFDGAVLLVASALVADADSLGVLCDDVHITLTGGRLAPVEVAAADEPGPLLPLVIDLAAATPPRHSHAGRRFSRRLAAEQLSAADALADRLGTARANVLLAAYASLVHQLTGVEGVHLDVVTRRAEVGSAVGPHSPALPMRLDFANARSLLEVVSVISGLRSGWSDCQGLPSPERTDVPPLDSSGLHAIFEDGDDGLPGTPVLCGRTSARSDIALIALPDGVCWEHGRSVTAAAADEIADEFERILIAALRQPEDLLAGSRPRLLAGYDRADGR